jgi:hypothetical protein
MSNTELRSNFVNVTEKLIDRIVAGELEQNSTNFIHLLFDLKYMTKPDTLKYVLNHTDFLECMLS